jgi:hypothetical protein
MELAFKTQRLRTVCEQHDVALKAFGPLGAGGLRTRLADLRAAASLADLPASHHEIVEGDPPAIRFGLSGGLTVAAAINHAVTPRSSAGELDLARIRRALVLEILR